MNLLKTTSYRRIIFNALIACLTVAGVFIMLRSASSATGLTDTGWANLKFYTVLSNIFAGVVALLQIVSDIKLRRYLRILKLTSATAVALTFSVVAFFFGPLYGWLNLYHGSNLFFHLIVPILCVAEYIFCAGGAPVRITHCLAASLSTVVYGSAYVINILINGIGVWPESNDWYGFLNWGPGFGALIFACIVLASFAMACILRFLRNKISAKEQ